VTTSIGCEGIDVEAGKHLLVAETPSQFAAAVLRVLAEEDLAQSMSKVGRLLVMERYDEAVVGRLTLTSLSSL
jgi:hypothetical protein